MSDVPVTRQPVPRPRWNDYQVVRRAAMNHPSSILQNAPSLSQTARQSVNQSGRQKGGWFPPTWTALATDSWQKWKLLHTQAPSKLAFREIFCWRIYSHILCFLSLIGV